MTLRGVESQPNIDHHALEVARRIVEYPEIECINLLHAEYVSPQEAQHGAVSDANKLMRRYVEMKFVPLGMNAWRNMGGPLELLVVAETIDDEGIQRSYAAAYRVEKGYPSKRL
jgi:hypothetical protein